MSKHGITTQFAHKATSAHRGGYGTVFQFRFPNGCGASVFREHLTKDVRWELAVVKGNTVCYNTQITGDVVRYATTEEINKMISQIAKL